MSTSNRFKRKERCMFTQAERKKIVQIIIEQKAFGEVKGNEFWKGIQGEFPNHSWHSLRNHYLRTIVPLLHNYNFAPEILKCLREGASPALGSSVTRKCLFSALEDKLIIDYVNKFPDARLGGNKFWQDMEADGIIKNRTWSSVRERYLKRLKPANSEKTLFGVYKKRENSAQPSHVNANSPSSSKEPDYLIDSEEMIVDASDIVNFSAEDLDLKGKLSGTDDNTDSEEASSALLTEVKQCDSDVQRCGTPQWPPNFPPAPLIFEDNENLDDTAELGNGELDEGSKNCRNECTPCNLSNSHQIGTSLANISSPSAVGTSGTVPEKKNVLSQTDPSITIPIGSLQDSAVSVSYEKLLTFHKDFAPVPGMKNVLTQTDPVKIFLPSEISPDFELVLFKRLRTFDEDIALELSKMLPYLRSFQKFK